MSETIFFRLLREEDKEQALTRDIDATRRDGSEGTTYQVQQETLRMMPGASFGYWASDDVRAIFSRLQPLECGARQVRVGLQTSDDFRFVRTSWEVNPDAVFHTDNGRPARWAPFAKGGEFAPFYADVHLLVNWGDGGAEVRTFGDPQSGRLLSRPQNTHWYFRPGLTWPRRTQAGLSVRVLPAGCVFADKGPAVFAQSPDELMWLLALLNSKPARCLIDLQMAFGSFEVGVIQRVPVPAASTAQRLAIAGAARSIHDLRRTLDTADETSHMFVLPILLQDEGATLLARMEAWNGIVLAICAEICELTVRTEAQLFELYGFSERDVAVANRELGTDVKGLPRPVGVRTVAADLASWSVGVFFERFDLRLGMGDKPRPKLPDPFEPLPAYSPGMLPEWRVPQDYPLRVDADGILVDDEGHEDDIVRRVEQVFELLWKEQSGARQQELCTMLGVASLRDWFRRMGTGGFWDDHFKRYSKSRRNAPIYWPLQSPRGLYTIWLYYHRLNQDTLPKLLGPRYLGGKIERVRQAIAELRPQDGSTRSLSRQEEKRLGELDELLVDLEEFGSRIQQVIRLRNERGETVGWSPKLDDGVVLNAAPLHALIPWPRKKKRAGKTVSDLLVYWQDLETGKYDWAHIAMHYWPDRVREKCREDRSLALAHGLDSEFFPGLREALREAAARAATEADTTDAELPYDADADDEEDDE